MDHQFMQDTTSGAEVQQVQLPLQAKVTICCWHVDLIREQLDLSM
jgi:hypothetical protein